jgi:L-asparaginase II
MVAALLLAIADPTPAQAKVLQSRARQLQRNWTGMDVGYLEATDAARLSL